MTKNQNDPGSMGQVRDLLMGTQLKDIEQRFLRQEDRFLREIADLRENTKTRLESLETFMKSEISTLLHRVQEEQGERAAAIKNEQKERNDGLKNEQRERTEALAQQAKNLATAEDALERKLTTLSGTLDKVERDLRQLLLSENGRLSDKIDEKYKDALNALSVTSSQIRNDMTTRSALSALLTEVAVKLAGQWQGSDILMEIDETTAAGGSADSDPSVRLVENKNGGKK